jgi:small-conductance mechanosensitive channel
MKKEVIFLHYNWLAWIDWTHLMEMLFVPICILVASLTIGIMLNKLINRRIENHLNIDEDSWFYIFINALRGVPVSLCLVVGLYWIVNTNTINIIEPLTRLFSYILFTVIILSITRVAARTINGFVTLRIERTQEKLPKTTLLNTILNVIIYAMGVLVVLQYYGISIAPILTAMGVGGMAVALALQETLANIFSGLHLIISKQLRLDDYIKVVKKRNLGLKAKQKMLGQILIAIVTMIVGTRVLGIDTTIWIPIALCAIIAALIYFYKLDYIRTDMTAELDLRRQILAGQSETPDIIQAMPQYDPEARR